MFWRIWGFVVFTVLYIYRCSNIRNGRLDGHPLWGVYFHCHVLEAHAHQGSAAQHVLAYECLDVAIDVSVARSELGSVVSIVSIVSIGGM